MSTFSHSVSYACAAPATARTASEAARVRMQCMSFLRWVSEESARSEQKSAQPRRARFVPLGHPARRSLPAQALAYEPVAIRSRHMREDVFARRPRMAPGAGLDVAVRRRHRAAERLVPVPAVAAG